MVRALKRVTQPVDLAWGRSQWLDKPNGFRHG